MTGAGQVFRPKKDSTCDLSLVVIRRGQGQYPGLKKQANCQEKRWREGQRGTEKISRGRLGKNRGRAGFGRDQVN